MILAAGCPLRGREIRWTFTLHEVKPYLEYQHRQVLYRECVLRFMGVGGHDEAKKDDEDYQAALQMQQGINRGDEK